MDVVELYSHNKNIRFITDHKCADSRSSGYHSAVYLQKRCYFLKIDRGIFPLKAFHEDLEALLRSSRQDGFSIVLALVENEHMGIRKLVIMFRYIGLIDTITTVTSKTPQASHVNVFK